MTHRVETESGRSTPSLPLKKKKSSNEGPITVLPGELITLIFSFLQNPQDLANVVCTSKSFSPLGIEVAKQQACLNLQKYTKYLHNNIEPDNLIQELKQQTPKNLKKLRERIDRAYSKAAQALATQESYYGGIQLGHAEQIADLIYDTKLRDEALSLICRSVVKKAGNINWAEKIIQKISDHSLRAPGEEALNRHLRAIRPFGDPNDTCDCNICRVFH